MTPVLLVLLGWALAAVVVTVVVARALRVRDARDPRPGDRRAEDVVVDLTALPDEPLGPRTGPRSAPRTGPGGDPTDLPRTG